MFCPNDGNPLDQLNSVCDRCGYRKPQRKPKTKRKTPVRESPEVQSTTQLLLTGRASELMDVIAEVKGRIDGSRNWGTRRLPAGDRSVLLELLLWLEVRESNLNRELAR